MPSQASSNFSSRKDVSGLMIDTFIEESQTDAFDDMNKERVDIIDNFNINMQKVNRKLASNFLSINF